MENVILDKQIVNLNQAVVVAHAPKLIVKDDKLIVNIQNSSISNSGSVIDVLKRTPYVIYDNSQNSISIAGRDKVLVLLNGKRLNNIQELSLINSSSILQIEIIENPSAKYEAEGHGVINIVTQRSAFEGLNGNITVIGEQGRKLSGASTVDLTYANKQLIINGNYGLVRDRGEGFNTTYERYKKNQYEFQSESYDVKNYYYSTMHNYSFGVEVQPHEYHTVSASTSGYTGKKGSNIHSRLLYIQNSDPKTTIDIFKQGEGNAFLNTSNLAYQFKNKGVEASIITDYTFSNNNNPTIIHNVSDKIADENLKIISDLQYNIFSIKGDLILPLKGIASKLELGTRFSDMSNKSDLSYASLFNAEWVIDKNSVSNIKLRERIFAFYGIVSGNINSWSYSVGLRAENTSTRNEWMLKDSTRNDVSFQMFPNIMLSRQINEQLRLRLSYNRRIVRPKYSSLNNSVLYIDPYSSRQGNPELKPTLYNSVSLNTTFNKLTTSVMAAFIEQPIDLLYFNDSIVIQKNTTMFVNVPDKWMFSFNLAYTFSFKKWNAQPFAALEYSRFSIVEDGVTYTSKRPMYYFRFNNQLQINNSVSFDVNVSYRQPAHGFKKFGKQLDLDLGIRKSLLKDKLKMQISYRSEFFPWKQKLDYSYKYIDFTYDGNSRNMLTINLKYQFNSTTKALRLKSTGGDELSRIR